MNYPYRCKNCGAEFIITMSVKKYETVIVYCPICKAKNPRRIFYSQGFSIIYKDDGFTKYIGKEE